MSPVPPSDGRRDLRWLGRAVPAGRVVAVLRGEAGLAAVDGRGAVARRVPGDFAAAGLAAAGFVVAAEVPAPDGRFAAAFGADGFAAVFAVVAALGAAVRAGAALEPAAAG